LGNKGIASRRLHVSHAFHSAMIESMLPSFLDMVGKIGLRQPKIPFLSNLSGDWITSQEATDPNYWGRHLRGTVRFGDGLRELLSNPARILLEVGPGETLTTLAQRHPDASAEQLILSSLPHRGKVHLPESALKHIYLSLGRLWLSGLSIDWESFYAEESRHRIPLPTYPFERQSYWVKPAAESAGIPEKKANKTDLQINDGKNGNQSGSRSLNDWFYVPSWRRTDVAALNGGYAEPAGSLIIFKDEHHFGTALIAHLLSNGMKLLVVSAGTMFRRQDKDHYTVRAGERHDYDLLLRAMRDDGRTIGHIFHLWSMTTDNEERSHAESQAKNFFGLFHLAQALESAGTLISAGKKVEITVVTNQLEDVAGNEQLRPEKALLLGPCKVIPQEYSNLTCRVVDVELQTTDSIAQARLVKQVLAESQADSVASIVAYRGPYRWIQIFEPIRCPAPIRTCLRQGGVYFLTGGLGGIGLTLAEHLAETRQAKLVLLGRSRLPSRENWPRLLPTMGKADSTRRKIEKVMRLEALGAEVLVLQTDVAIQAELETAVAQAHQRFGAIHGVIHAAGEVGSGLISAKTEAMVAQVFASKVQGTRALQAIFKDEPLDFMFLCSSLATIAGGLSKIDYCSANAYLDAIARAAYPESAFPVISVNWDSWREVGMAADMAMPIGVGISPHEGVEVFERILNGVTRSQIIISTLDLNTRLSQTQEDLVAQPLVFATARKQGEQVEQGEYPRPALQTIFTAPDSELEKGIAEIWQSLLGINAIGINDNLFELGGDSLLGIQLLSRVRARFAVELHPAEFFRSPTIAGLAALVETKLIDEIEYS
ncbi:MAG: SDR family NAD(P)-dependent oxidoreductase, partial [Pseudomonadota bacterium]|nr:SDR family NAD(P)-dependent oxidoreductase [Pseudomonadota bacterium]